MSAELEDVVVPIEDPLGKAALQITIHDCGSYGALHMKNIIA
jgi:hypothetical protein